jgi:hypothetical protein
LVKQQQQNPQYGGVGGGFEGGIVDLLRESLERLLTLGRAGVSPNTPTHAVAVATAAFRDATNGEAVAAQLAHELGIAVQVLAQADESTLGFQSAVSAAADGGELDEEGSTLNDVIVWDFGGGSFQLSTLDAGEEEYSSAVGEDGGCSSPGSSLKTEEYSSAAVGEDGGCSSPGASLKKDGSGTSRVVGFGSDLGLFKQLDGWSQCVGRGFDPAVFGTPEQLYPASSSQVTSYRSWRRHHDPYWGSVRWFGLFFGTQDFHRRDGFTLLRTGAGTGTQLQKKGREKEGVISSWF